MEERHAHQQKLLKCILLEMKGQERKFSLGPESNLKLLRSNGALMQPLTIIRKGFGYADYPEISFKLSYASETSLFKDNCAIECFVPGEEPIKGILLGMNNMRGEIRLFSPDFPDWIEDKGLAVKLAPDHRTFELMQKAIKALDSPSRNQLIFNKIHGDIRFGDKPKLTDSINFQNENLNESQRLAVNGMVTNDDLILLHGPPGTGKTTTLVEAIYQKVQLGERILVTAPSNAAVDHISAQLFDAGLKILRVGNSLKVNELIFPHTPEGKMKEAKEFKEIKKLKIRSEELRRMSYQYKRNFGRDERAQRSLLIKESKIIRREIREIKKYFEQKLFEHAEVVIGTPIGLAGFLPEEANFDTLFFDEAGQAIEPLAWVVFPFAKSWVLAGDPHQLPPTVISQEAVEHGLNVSILEQCFRNCESIHFLDTQYRMPAIIAEFSNRRFYGGRLKSASRLNVKGDELIFYDTAGTGFEEQVGKDGVSLLNEGELDVLLKFIQRENFNLNDVSLISPYSGQVQRAKELLPPGVRVSTIDSFQGQEDEIILLSLVRSNADGVIGFLKDYRRLNVALTRARRKLIVIGDSSTIGQDEFYSSFLSYAEEIGSYRSAWELIE